MGSGHVRAAAACALSFLACHDLGAVGDACLDGPFRRSLLAHGAMVRLPFPVGSAAMQRSMGPSAAPCSRTAPWCTPCPVVRQAVD